MRSVSTIAALLLLGGCAVGPDYHVPAAPSAAAFKELQGWQPAMPQDALPKGPWWQIYHDPDLDQLERMVVVSNQNIAAFAAQYRNALALVAEARASLFPTLGLGASDSRSRGTSITSSRSITRTQYAASGSASWEPDLWGRVRRQVEGSVANAQVSAADLANATLSAQAALATDYFELRAADALAELLRTTVADYRRAYVIAENQYRAGVASRADAANAEALLHGAEAQLAGAGVARAQYEHAIAVLTGQAPAALSIPSAALAAQVPVVPPGLPSALLQRRPDIAAAERAVAAANAQIGVATAAFYPAIALSASGGFTGDPLRQLFTLGNAVWSLAASGSETLFAGGARSAAVAAAQASREQATANYRQSVLAAFQQVEDALSTLRILEQQAAAEAVAVHSATDAVRVAMNAYRAGTVPYTSVITAELQLQADRQAALTVQQNRLVASVALITALGGGWTEAQLPDRAAITRGR
jgi:NodT family efflux transporter outer membrane factor (OMF) lipoprotein